MGLIWDYSWWIINSGSSPIPNGSENGFKSQAIWPCEIMNWPVESPLTKPYALGKRPVEMTTGLCPTTPVDMNQQWNKCIGRKNNVTQTLVMDWHGRLWYQKICRTPMSLMKSPCIQWIEPWITNIHWSLNISVVLTPIQPIKPGTSIKHH